MSETWETERARKWREEHPLRDYVRKGIYDVASLHLYENRELTAVYDELERALPKAEYGDGYFTKKQTIIVGQAESAETQLAIQFKDRILAELRRRDPLGPITGRADQYARLSLDLLSEAELRPDLHAALYWHDGCERWFGISAARLERIESLLDAVSSRLDGKEFSHWLSEKPWRSPLRYRDYLRLFCEPNTVVHEALTLFFATVSLRHEIEIGGDRASIAAYAALAGESYSRLLWRRGAEGDAMRGRDEAASRKTQMDEAKANKEAERSAVLKDALERDRDHRAAFLLNEDSKSRAKLLKKLAKAHDESADKPLFIRNGKPLSLDWFELQVARWVEAGVVGGLEKYMKNNRL